MDDATTPTNETFSKTALATQKPLPNPAYPSDSAQNADSASDKSSSRVQRENSQRKMRASRDADDMNVDDSDGEAGQVDDAGGASDGESVNADGSKVGKKKKSQRFYCTDYPPCNLSFTRSEHLARHIRKHTGERPFQCHCSRRFSRLDNLRQHAQTVHVNEDIPIDSLAATGTRFQRQIRTDRVRAPGGRARASTAGSLGVPMRGHSKSLSTSSIASVSSVASSVYSGRDDLRRRPAPLVMADPRDPRSRLSLEAPYRVGTGPDGPYRPLSPTEFTTPTSATFSNGPGSPRWGNEVVSPSPSHSRPQSMYVADVRTPGRRLSVPSAGGNPFQSPPGAAPGRTLFSQGQLNASNSGLYSPSNTGGPLASPTASTASTWSRRESISSVPDVDWRRRTWHPDSREFHGSTNGASSSVTTSASANSINSPPPGGSRLSHVISSSQYQTAPVASLPIANPATQQTNLRLPGIESFDPLPHHRPSTPPRRIPSPMAIDSEGQPSKVGPPASILRSSAIEPASDGRRLSSNPWDMSLHRGLTKLEIASGSSPRDNADSWANEANRAVQAQAEQTLRSQHPQHSVHFESDVRAPHAPFGSHEIPSGEFTRGHHHTVSAPSFNAATSRQLKRQGWYNGPNVPSGLAGGRENRVDRMVHPNLANGFSGFPTRMPQTVHEHAPHDPQQQRPSQQQQQQQQQQQYPAQQREQQDQSTDPLSRLDALVAVATSEVQHTTAAY